MRNEEGATIAGLGAWPQAPSSRSSGVCPRYPRCPTGCGGRESMTHRRNRPGQCASMILITSEGHTFPFAANQSSLQLGNTLIRSMRSTRYTLPCAAPVADSTATTLGIGRKWRHRIIAMDAHFGFPVIIGDLDRHFYSVTQKPRSCASNHGRWRHFLACLGKQRADAASKVGK